MDPTHLRRILILLRRSPSLSPPGGCGLLAQAFHLLPRSNYSTNTDSFTQLQDNNKSNANDRGKWFTLPPYTSTVNGAALGKAMSTNGSVKSVNETTALKWVLQCCPQLPRNLVQKLFRLRQVRRESSSKECSSLSDQEKEHPLKRVAAKDSMNVGDKIFLPSSVTVNVSPVEELECHCSEEEVTFIRSLELYKDDAIIVINKPPGMAVQGGIGVKRSLDELSASCLSYDYSDPPRLVHRLDRDCSGILVMGRTQSSTTALHSIFREKTFAASNDDVLGKKRILQRKYLALVLGRPRHPKGLVSAPLGKMVVDNGKSDRITVVENAHNTSSQHAMTEYRVIASSPHGYSWLELTPLTGRKHQIRVHCAEVLGTPIVGDYKYGWQAHRNWKCMPLPGVRNDSDEKLPVKQFLPFGIDLESGSISDKLPRLHLHCKQMVLPNVSQALCGLRISSDYDFSELKSLQLNAPLPSFMKKSWDILGS
ncbi:hypothetical protein Tsubulata_025671 [Turnera subulata]|uniref:Pseudouridine synthase RsuA/RluA-like domain-containing protein n=1 Tax=Turnera subulata TaxID=218843 RepID=A0A9Q0JI40_9ROSI|nr:hypothetical protein Tsubulata_025671 [Turnera subulata]